MKYRLFSNRFWVKVCLLVFILVVSLPVPLPAQADMAPPETAPGSGISPGEEVTAVRMVAEWVTLTVLPNRKEEVPRARTEAIFQMRNLGTETETMEARFPLTYGEAVYYYEMSPESFPEISDVQVKVNGKSVPVRRELFTDPSAELGMEQPPRDVLVADVFPKESGIPWAVFPVTFPPGQDVTVTVTYTTLSFGYEPFFTFRYILETGAGWKDTIGSADITVVLPYDASEQNVVFDDASGRGEMTPGAQFSGKEARWHFEDFEPGPEDNFAVMIVQPFAWQKVLTERKNTTKTPKDGEAWGRLGKAIKEAIRYPKGMRADKAGKELYREAVAAYDKAVTLLPKDALWHYGFADLLFTHVYYVEVGEQFEVSEIVRLNEELQAAVSLAPDNQDIVDLTRYVASWLPGLIEETTPGDFVFLALTATPTAVPTWTATAPPPKPTFTASPQPSPSAKPLSTGEAENVQPMLDRVQSPTPAPPTQAPSQTVIPFCSGSALLLPLLAGLLWLAARLK